MTSPVPQLGPVPPQAEPFTGAPLPPQPGQGDLGSPTGTRLGPSPRTPPNGVVESTYRGAFVIAGGDDFCAARNSFANIAGPAGDVVRGSFVR